MDHDLKKLGLNISFETVAEVNAFKTVEDMFFAIGVGDNNQRELLRKVSVRRDQDSDLDPLTKLPMLSPRPVDQAQFGIQVRGTTDIYNRLARCCNPVEGEAIIGYVTRGNGLTIHRSDCHNVINERQRERLMPVNWGAAKEAQHYPVPVRIEAWDRVGLWHDITEVLKDTGININAVQMVPHRHPDKVTLLTTIMVDSVDQLSLILDKLARVQDVIDVRRDAQSVRVAAP